MGLFSGLEDIALSILVGGTVSGNKLFKPLTGQLDLPPLHTREKHSGGEW